MTILSKRRKPDIFESQDSLKFIFTNIRDLRNVNLSLNQTLLTFLLYVRQTWMTQSTDNFSVRGYLPLIRKHSFTRIHGLAVYLKEGLPFAHDFYLENSVDSYLCFRLALHHSVSYFLSLL